MSKLYYNKDADIKILKKKTIAIVGYGSQGHAHARNLHDSGLKVIVGLRKGSAFWKRAQKDGLNVMTVPEAAKKADIMMILVPDDKQKAMYEKDIEPHLSKGMALAFGHGFNIHFGQIVPPKDVDVFMVAPKGPGHLVRRTYEQGAGVPCLMAIHQNVTKKAKQVALAYAKGIGGTRAGVGGTRVVGTGVARARARVVGSDFPKTSIAIVRLVGSVHGDKVYVAVTAKRAVVNTFT